MSELQVSKWIDERVKAQDEWVNRRMSETTAEQANKCLSETLWLTSE